MARKVKAHQFKPSRREYHIMKTKAKADRKYRLIRDIYGLYQDYNSYSENGKELGKLNYGLKHYGYLRKGKIHCSCPLCRAKVKYNGYKISDIKKLEKMKFEEE